MTRVETWSNIFSDFFVNLGAGWFGAALIIPTFSNDLLKLDFRILMLDASFGMRFST